LKAPRGASAHPSSSDQDAVAPASGGAGPGLGPEAPTSTCARILRMTARSCRVAIPRRYGRPPFQEFQRPKYQLLFGILSCP
jgi:hypothetical protein